MKASWDLKRVTLLVWIVSLWQSLAESTQSILEPLPAARTAACPNRNFLHLEVDETNSDQLLASSVGALGIIDTKFKNYSDIVGNGRWGYNEGYGPYADFNSITGFCQMNHTHVLIADYENHCIRWVNRVTRRTSMAAGKCQNHGNTRGVLDSARFYRPYSIIKGMSKNKFFITEYHNHAISLLDLNNQTVSTFYQSMDTLLSPMGIFYDSATACLFVTLYKDLVVINSTDMALARIKESVYLNKMVPISPQALWIFSNPSRHGSSNAITQLTLTPSGEWNITMVSELNGNKPYAVALHNKTDGSAVLYIGERGAIKETKLTEGISSTTTSFYTSTYTTAAPSMNTSVPDAVSVEMIVGISAGVFIFLVIIIIVAIVCAIRRKRLRKGSKGHHTDADECNNQNMDNHLSSLHATTSVQCSQEHPDMHNTYSYRYDPEKVAQASDANSMCPSAVFDPHKEATF